MRLTALRCGHVSMDVGLFEGGGLQGEHRVVPSMAFLLEHAEGLLLWDTSMNPAVCTDAVGYWGPVAESLVVPQVSEEETAVARLRGLGVDPSEVRFVVNSHLHNDHCGMNRFFPDATVVARREEHGHARAAAGQPFSGYVADDFLGDEVRLELLDYEGSHDLFGDGSVVLLSTVGHTPGHQSLQLTFPSGRSIILTGDAVYSADQLATGRPPGLTVDEGEARRSAERLAALAEAGATVLVAHEAAHWSGVTSTGVVHAEP